VLGGGGVVGHDVVAVDPGGGEREGHDETGAVFAGGAVHEHRVVVVSRDDHPDRVDQLRPALVDDVVVDGHESDVRGGLRGRVGVVEHGQVVHGDLEPVDRARRCGALVAAAQVDDVGDADLGQPVATGRVDAVQSI
ncbi:unnamed protein product, partial [Penicillium discolor]